MKKRLLTIGCSFTQGEELADPANTAWPARLAKDGQFELTNLGLSGASNDYIFRSTVEATIQNHYDLVIIQWTEPSRAEVWNDIVQLPVQISANPGGAIIDRGLPWVRDYYKYSYSDLYGHQLWAIKILTLQQYFKSYNQQYLMVSLSGLQTHGYWKEFNQQLSHLWSGIDTVCYPGWPHQGLSDWPGDAPLGPGGHPLELGHERIANELKKYIRN